MGHGIQTDRSIQRLIFKATWTRMDDNSYFFNRDADTIIYIHIQTLFQSSETVTMQYELWSPEQF